MGSGPLSEVGAGGCRVPCSCGSCQTSLQVVHQGLASWGAQERKKGVGLEPVARKGFVAHVRCLCVSWGRAAQTPCRLVLEGTPKTCPGRRPLQLPPWQVAAQHPLHTSGDAELICLQDIGLQDGDVSTYFCMCV